jgi:transposase
MKRSLSSAPTPPSPKKTYNTVKMTKDTRNTLANVYVALKNDGMKPNKIREIFSNAGYPVPATTIQTWLSTMKSQRVALKEQSNAGRPFALSVEQENLVVGYVLDKNHKREQCTLRAVAAFAKHQFGFTVSNATIQRTLCGLGFSSQTMKLKARGFTKTNEQLGQEVLDWVMEMRKTKKLKGLFGSIDFTFTSHRTDVHKTYSATGGAQPLLANPISRFTNCIITCEWSDGVNRTPAMLFTYNSAFRNDRNATKRRDKQTEHLRTCLSTFEIDSDRIMYVGKQNGEGRTYVSESASLVRLFFHKYKIRDHVIFSDNGNSFKEGKKSVLLKLGFRDHVFYPADVHQYLSPNDNSLHGVAKAKWRAINLDFTDDVKSSLELLRLLDDVPSEVRKSWWQRNFLMVPRPSLKMATDLVTKNQPKYHEFHKKCYVLFQNTKLKDY